MSTICGCHRGKPPTAPNPARADRGPSDDAAMQAYRAALVRLLAFWRWSSRSGSASGARAVYAARPGPPGLCAVCVARAASQGCAVCPMLGVATAPTWARPRVARAPWACEDRPGARIDRLHALSLPRCAPLAACLPACLRATPPSRGAKPKSARFGVYSAQDSAKPSAAPESLIPPPLCMGCDASACARARRCTAHAASGRQARAGASSRCHAGATHNMAWKRLETNVPRQARHRSCHSAANTNLKGEGPRFPQRRTLPA